MRITVTSHGIKQLRARMGTGCAPEELAERAWFRNEPPPDEWEVPMRPGFAYRKYGDCVFVYGRVEVNRRTGRKRRPLVTVVGPFGHGKKWESPYPNLTWNR